jgi:hypothetical protein
MFNPQNRPLIALIAKDEEKDNTIIPFYHFIEKRDLLFF